MSLSFENLKYFHQQSKLFFNKYIKNFHTHMQLETFNKFRCYFFGLAKEVKLN